MVHLGNRVGTERSYWAHNVIQITFEYLEVARSRHRHKKEVDSAALWSVYLFLLVIMSSGPVVDSYTHNSMEE